jgi:hypothetical protein
MEENATLRIRMMMMMMVLLFPNNNTANARKDSPVSNAKNRKTTSVHWTVRMVASAAWIGGGTTVVA